MSAILPDYAYRAQGRPRARPRAKSGLTPAGVFWTLYLFGTTALVGFSIGYGYALEIFERAW